ncbi:hypothetical protein [Bacillus mycoides]|uniref:hypothetical protein n=1 Tax=Bacillus mycoides TaxID=1405 RepID=UPI001C022557|nr:hypothetical protein [Bacillus mycoides]QWI47154.1 hypothetical protein EXW55_30280 [Bacillus mycoides]
MYGKFAESIKKEIFFYYSYTLLYNGKKYYTNDILLGDYTTTKVLDGLIHQSVMNKQSFAQSMQDPLKVLGTNLQAEFITHIVFFGVHLENDYHILVACCYYDDEAKLTFS